MPQGLHIRQTPSNPIDQPQLQFRNPASFSIPQSVEIPTTSQQTLVSIDINSFPRDPEFVGFPLIESMLAEILPNNVLFTEIQFCGRLMDYLSQ